MKDAQDVRLSWMHGQVRQVMQLSRKERAKYQKRHWEVYARERRQKTERKKSHLMSFLHTVHNFPPHHQLSFDSIPVYIYIYIYIYVYIYIYIYILTYIIFIMLSTWQVGSWAPPPKLKDMAVAGHTIELTCKRALQDAYDSLFT